MRRGMGLLAAAGLYLKRESGRWRGLITSEPG